MSFQIGIKAGVVGSDIWVAEISPEDLKRLGRPLASVGERSVIGVTTPRFIDGSIFFTPSDVSVLNSGSSKNAIIVRLGASERAPTIANVKEGVNDDAAFVSACKKHLLPEVAKLAQELIAEIRRDHPGRMHEGKARKWVNQPSNFLAITIQNRDQSLAIHVKGRPDKHPNTALELRGDRPGYSRFKISKSSELAPALQIIRRSAAM